MSDPGDKDSGATKGRRALLLGGSRGLGAAIALELGLNGWNVDLTYRREADKAAAIVEELEVLGRSSTAYQLELGELTSVEELFEALRGSRARYDLVVANAARTIFMPLRKAETRHVERTFAISVTGVLRAIQLSVPLLQPQASIVAVSGADTRTFVHGHGLLAAAKAALDTMVRYLAVELGPKGIRVFSVSPGWIDTDSLRLMLGPLFDQARQMEEQTNPQRRAASAQEVAAAIVALAETDSPWLSGSTIDLDGGAVFAFGGRFATLATRILEVKE